MVKEFFPDKTPIDEWFYDYQTPSESALGKKYLITDYGAQPEIAVQTQTIQKVIDLAYEQGGGVVVVPKGVFLTGALFFKKGVHLLVEKDGVLKGSDKISDFPVVKTRIEGQTCEYFSAIINADGCDGFTLFGEGVIDGSGEEFWKAFWLRRKWNPACTNKDEQRPRILYVSNSNDIFVSGVTFLNSPFWTTHYYKCKRVKILGVKIITGKEAPSSNGIDLDACEDVLVKGCTIKTDDDGVVLKGGKGAFADTDPDNGPNQRIIVEDCEFTDCHGVITCGSEAVHCKNVLVRRIIGNGVGRVLWLKLRPDTPQTYEYVTVDGVKGDFRNFILAKPWTQFFDLQGRTDKPKSVARNITLKNCDCEAGVFFAVDGSNDYDLKDFVIEDCQIVTENGQIKDGVVEKLFVKNLTILKP